ncbi:MAG: hypothetical protein ACI9A7_001640, partial [Cyclobacteriaceae bacterium]
MSTQIEQNKTNISRVEHEDEIDLIQLAKTL